MTLHTIPEFFAAHPAWACLLLLALLATFYAGGVECGWRAAHSRLAIRLLEADRFKTTRGALLAQIHELELRVSKEEVTVTAPPALPMPKELTECGRHRPLPPGAKVRP